VEHHGVCYDTGTVFRGRG